MRINAFRDMKAAKIGRETAAHIAPVLDARDTRRRRRGTPTVIAITSDESRVGRTTIAANLAVALGDRGNEVLVLDADSVHPSVDAALGLGHQSDTGHLFAAERTLEELLLRGPPGVQLAAGRVGDHQHTSIGVREQAALIWALDTLTRPVDLVFIDTAADRGAEVATLVRAAHHVVVVVGDEPASIHSALGLITRLSREHAIDHFKVLTSRTLTPLTGAERYRELLRACDRQLGVVLEYVGTVPQDNSVGRAARSQQSVLVTAPCSRVARAFRTLAAQAETWAGPERLRGHLEFFVEGLVEVDRHRIPRGWS